MGCFVDPSLDFTRVTEVFPVTLEDTTLNKLTRCAEFMGKPRAFEGLNVDGVRLRMRELMNERPDFCEAFGIVFTDEMPLIREAVNKIAIPLPAP